MLASLNGTAAAPLEIEGRSCQHLATAALGQEVIAAIRPEADLHVCRLEAPVMVLQPFQQSHQVLIWSVHRTQASFTPSIF